MMKPIWEKLVFLLSNKTAFSRAEKIVERISSHIKGNSLLDVGCGTGHISLLIKRNINIKVQMLDIHPRLGQWGQRLVAIPCASVISKKYGLEYILYEGSTLPFKADSFDTILLAFVLHHAVNPEQLLNEAFRVAKKRIIVLEDLLEKKSKTSWKKFIDSMINLEFFQHPHAIKSRDEWVKLFGDFGGKLLNEKKFTSHLFGFHLSNIMFIINKI